MTTATLYHNPRCSQSRRALELLRERGVEPQVVEYLKTPLNAAALGLLLQRLGLGPRALLRRKEAGEAGLLDDPTATDEALIKGLARHPAAIQRPILVVGDKAVIGRPPERVLELL